MTPVRSRRGAWLPGGRGRRLTDDTARQSVSEREKVGFMSDDWIGRVKPGKPICDSLPSRPCQADRIFRQRILVHREILAYRPRTTRPGQDRGGGAIAHTHLVSHHEHNAVGLRHATAHGRAVGRWCGRRLQYSQAMGFLGQGQVAHGRAGFISNGGLNRQCSNAACYDDGGRIVNA